MASAATFVDGARGLTRLLRLRSPKRPRQFEAAGLGWTSQNSSAHRAFPQSFGDALSPCPNSPPDRLSIDPSSPHYQEAILTRGIGIRFKGQERHDVEEYCVSESWIRVPAGKALDRHGRPLLIKLTGPVEPYFLDVAADEQA